MIKNVKDEDRVDKKDKIIFLMSKLVDHKGSLTKLVQIIQTKCKDEKENFIVLEKEQIVIWLEKAEERQLNHLEEFL